MATRPIVPINDNEGGIGTALKRWATGFFASLQSAAHTITSFTVSGFVKNDASGVLSGGNSIAAGDLPSGIDAVKIGAGLVSNTEYGYLDGVTSALQTQLAGKFGSVFVGNTTRDISLASGSQVVTGVGFTPRVVIFFCAVVDFAGKMSVGFDNLSFGRAVFSKHPVAAGAWGVYTAGSILILQAAADYYAGNISAFSSDGFTIAWVKVGSPTGSAYVNFVALG